MSTTQWAWQQEIPIFAIHDLHQPAVATALRTLQPTVVCVACFPWRIPESLLPIPNEGFINLHPSRLPHFRGPVPLFWQLRAGLTQSAITLHQMTKHFDRGSIIDQKTVTFPDGADSAALDINFAQAGAGLLVRFIQALQAGHAVTRTPQPAGGSTQSWPQVDDFVLDRQWSARHAFNFMRGTTEWHQPYPIMVGNETYLLTTALDYEMDQTLPTAIIEKGSELAIQFNPGVLYTKRAQRTDL